MSIAGPGGGIAGSSGLSGGSYSPGASNSAAYAPSSVATGSSNTRQSGPIPLDLATAYQAAAFNCDGLTTVVAQIDPSVGTALTGAIVAVEISNDGNTWVQHPSQGDLSLAATRSSTGPISVVGFKWVRLRTKTVLAGASCSVTFFGQTAQGATVGAVGTVTNIAVTVPPFLSIAGSPISGSGTFAFTLKNATQLGYPIPLLGLPPLGRISGWTQRKGSTTRDVFNRAALTTAGTLSNSDDTTTTGAAMGKWLTAGTTGSNASVSGGSLYILNWSPMYETIVQTDATITQTSLLCGFADAPASGDLSAQNVASWVYDTGQDGTAFWRFVTANGANQTRTATTLAFSASTTYRLMTICTPTACYGLAAVGGLDPTLYATNALTLPTATTAMADVNYIEVLSNSARFFKSGWGFTRQQ